MTLNRKPPGQIQKSDGMQSAVPPSRRTILLLGNRRQSLTVVRSLTKAGWKVIVGINEQDDRDAYAYRSRYVADVWHHNGWNRDEFDFSEALNELLIRRPEIGAIYPIDETAIRQIDALRESLVPRTVVVTTNRRALDVSLDKPSMLRLCRETGIPHETFEVIDGAELETVGEKISLPCVVKPYDAETLYFGIKAAIVNNETELRALAGRDDWAGRKLIVQEFAKGPRHSVHFAAKNGELRAVCDVLVHRTDRLDGTGVAVSGVTVQPTDDIVQDIRVLAKALDYTGIGLAQYLIDPATGKRCFIELNPRLGGNYTIADFVGHPLAVWAVELAQGHDIGDNKGLIACQIGARFARSFGSLAGCRFEQRNGVINSVQVVKILLLTLWEAMRANVHTTWTWRDPMPSLLEFARSLSRKPTPEIAPVIVQATNSKRSAADPATGS
ncbi:MAG: hypothetical protein AAF434_05200 [Pseudomonadota bacterium]